MSIWLARLPDRLDNISSGRHDLVRIAREHDEAAERETNAHDARVRRGLAAIARLDLAHQNAKIAAYEALIAGEEFVFGGNPVQLEFFAARSMSPEARALDDNKTDARKLGVEVPR